MISKMVAVRQIMSLDEDAVPEYSPIIVKVESLHPDTTMPSNGDVNSIMLPVNVCSVCGQKLSSIYGLKRHMLLHVAPTVPCPICPLKYARSDYVKKHIKKYMMFGPRETQSHNNNIIICSQYLNYLVVEQKSKFKDDKKISFEIS